MYYNSDYLLKQLAQQNQIITSRITALENLIASKGLLSGGSSGGNFTSSFAKSVDSCVNGYCLFGDTGNSSNVANLETIKDQISFKNIGFQNLVSGSYMFAYQPLTEINLNSALFNNIIDSSYMFYYSKLTKIDMPNATFANLQDASNMFLKEESATEILIKNATFAKVVNTSSMFNGCSALTQIDLSSATFEALDIANASNMFANVKQSCVLKIPSTTYDKLYNKGSGGPLSTGWTKGPESDGVVTLTKS